MKKHTTYFMPVLVLVFFSTAAWSHAAVLFQFTTNDASPPGDDGYDAAEVSVTNDPNTTAPTNGTQLALGDVGLSRFWNSEWAGFDTSCINGITIDNSSEFATGYWTVTVSANSGYELDLTSLTFGSARGGSSGTRLYQLYAEVDGGTFTYGDTPIDSSPGGNETGTRAAPRSVSVDLTGATYQGIDSVTFRYYPLTPADGNTIGFDGWTLNGTVSVIPEPSTMLLLSVGACVLIRRRRGR